MPLMDGWMDNIFIKRVLCLAPENGVNMVALRNSLVTSAETSGGSHYNSIQCETITVPEITYMLSKLRCLGATSLYLCNL